MIVRHDLHPNLWDGMHIIEVRPAAVHATRGCERCRDRVDCAENVRRGGVPLCETLFLERVGAEEERVAW